MHGLTAASRARQLITASRLLIRRVRIACARSHACHRQNSSVMNSPGRHADMAAPSQPVLACDELGRSRTERLFPIEASLGLLGDAEIEDLLLRDLLLDEGEILPTP